MSIRSELNNTKHYLRESRKAILGRGGEISEKAGLKDIPEAVWSIPADASLAFREDSEIAYEKAVPVGAEEYALVKSLGGMIYKDEETQTLRDTKPTSLESLGANLFDESAITYASKINGVINSKLGVVENGYLKAKYGKRGNTVLWGPFAMHLTAGTYTISADMYLGSSTTSKIMYLGLSKRYSSITETVAVAIAMSSYDVWERRSVTVTLTEDGDYYLEAEARGSAETLTNLDARFKNIQIQSGETATEFHPFSAEPIDTLEIPEAVQAFDGYGQSNPDNAEEYNYIDFIANEFVSCGHIVDGAWVVYDEVKRQNISQLLKKQLKVEGGGSIISNNERKDAVPSTLKYTIKVGS